MKIVLSQEKLKEIKADIKLVFIVNKNLEHRFVKDHTILKKMGFKGADGESCYVQQSNTLYIGIEELTPSEVRIGASTAIRFLRKMDVKSLKLGFYGLTHDCPVVMIKALVEGFVLGDYDFDMYKTTKTLHPIQHIIISVDTVYEKLETTLKANELQKYILEAQIVANATNETRTLINQSPENFTPMTMANIAQTWAKESGLECRVYDECYLQEQGMNAFYAVAKASSNPPRLIHLSYTPENPIAHVFLVGKGLTYDSGGLSLKPSDFMVSMKADKSGACAVLGVMKALKELQIPIEVHGVLGMSENMVGGNAYKPDDILIAKNKKSIEVRNTDAEGRLVLADCLCYIQDWAKENSKSMDYLIDVATLTGACVVGVGEYTIGVMGHNHELNKKIKRAAKSADEMSAYLPFNKHLKKLIKSEIADVCNISSSRYGGAITAGLFLNEFIYEENKNQWVHLDIAGPAYVEKIWGYNPIGASGAGVRLLLKLLKHIEFEKNGFFNQDGHHKKG